MVCELNAGSTEEVGKKDLHNQLSVITARLRGGIEFTNKLHVDRRRLEW
jgi:hypothetical protein